MRELAQSGRDEIVPSMGIWRAGIPVSGICSQCVQRKYLTDLGDLLQAKCDVLELLHSAGTLRFSSASKSDVCVVWMALSFELTREISIDKFEIQNLQIHLWNLIF